MSGLDIEGTLSAHTEDGQGNCSCSPDWLNLVPWSPAHVAAALREQMDAALASAWEACWSAVVDMPWPTPSNPTRPEVLDALLAIRPAAHLSDTERAGDAG